MKQVRVVHHKIWSDSKAKYIEWWTLWELRKPFLRRKKQWYQVKDWDFDIRFPVRYYSESDAKAAAKHYGTKIEEALK